MLTARTTRRLLPIAPSIAALALAPRAAAAQPAAPAPPASAAAGDDTAPAVVTVHGAKSPAGDAGGIDLRGQDVRDVPGTFGDPFQAIQAMPGVAATASGLPYFYVRGAPPADTGYFLDGIPLPALFHIGPGPSVVPPALVDHIDFYPSTAPASLGRYAGGVISGTTTPPATAARGEAEARLFDASAFVESPIGDGSTALVAGRYGYPNLLLSVFAPSLSLQYWDYTARLTHRLTDADAISLFAIGAYDHEDDSSQDLTPVDTEFHRIDLRYDHRWSDGSLRVATTFGHDYTSTLFSGSNDVVTTTSGRLRLEIEQRLGGGARLSAGADANAAHFVYAITGPNAATSPIDAEQVAGAYADVALRPARGIDLDAGIRLDAYRASGTITPSVDPRLTARVAIAPGWTWVSTFGVAHQPPAYVVPVPGLELDPSTGLQGAYQMAEGVEARLPLDVRATMTGFYNFDHDTSDFVGDCGSLAIDCSFVNRVNGRTYGVEVLVQRALSRRLTGWLAYTLSRAERWIGAATYLSPFDRTHVLSAVLTYAFGAGFRVGARATYYTGRPDFPDSGVTGSGAGFALGPGQIVQQRLPDFFRLDLRAEKRWEIGPRRRWLSVVLEFFDATLAKEAVDFRCNPIDQACVAEEVGPIALPSVGVEGGF